MLQLQGNTAALRERELAALDHSNQAIQKLIYSLQDQAAAAADLAAKQSAIASERYGLEGQLFQLLGYTAGLRARELEKLDQSNRPLQTYLYALEDQKKAEEELAKAAEESAQKQMDAMASVHNSISDALKSLMGQSEEFNQMQQQQAKITLQSALSVAKAGGSLVGFAGLDDALKNVGNIDKSKYSSYVDYAREFGQSVGLLSQLEKVTNARGSHANGLDNVPFDGYMARLHKGEQVVTARESAAGGIVGSEVKSMKEDIKAMLIPLVEEAVRSRRILSKWDGDGLPEVRAVA